MSFGDLTDLLLTAVVTYGAVVLALVFLLAAMGVPLPSTLFVIAGGAFIQQGVLAPASAIGLGMVGVVLGDTLSYGIGRMLRGPVQRRFGQSHAWLRAEATFARQAALAIVLTRFLLTPIAVPVNLIAGGSAYPLGRFVALAAGGELLWMLGYGALGYLFGSQWEYVSDLVSNTAGLLVGLLITGAGVYALVRWRAAVPARAALPAARDQAP